MTPVSTTTIPPQHDRSEKSHNWYCCFNCKCSRRVSPSQSPTPTDKSIVKVAENSLTKDESPKGPVNTPREHSFCISDMHNSKILTQYFEPRDCMEIDVWFCTEYK